MAGACVASARRGVPGQSANYLLLVIDRHLREQLLVLSELVAEHRLLQVLVATLCRSLRCNGRLSRRAATRGNVGKRLGGGRRACIGVCC